MVLGCKGKKKGRRAKKQGGERKRRAEKESGSEGRLNNAPIQMLLKAIPIHYQPK